MPTYMIFVREGEVVDHEAMAAYRSNVASARTDGMKPLAVYGAMETFEGEPADGLVILEFPNAEEAKAWYFSPEYQAKAKLRQQAAPYRCFMVEGME
jgi:uncharacterized protein (DUF1330 family)